MEIEMDNNSPIAQTKNHNMGKIGFTLWLITLGIAVVVSFLAACIFLLVNIEMAQSAELAGPLIVPAFFIYFSLISTIVLSLSILITNLIKHHFRAIIIPFTVSLVILLAWLTNQYQYLSLCVLPLFIGSMVSPIYFLFINKETKILKSNKIKVLFILVFIFSISVLLIELIKPNYCYNKCLDLNKNLRSSLDIHRIFPSDSFPGYTVEYSGVGSLQPTAEIRFNRFTELNKEVSTDITVDANRTKDESTGINGDTNTNGKEIDINGTKANEACTMSGDNGSDVGSNGVSWTCNITWKTNNIPFTVKGNLDAYIHIDENSSDMQNMLTLMEKISKVVVENSAYLSK